MNWRDKNRYKAIALLTVANSSFARAFLFKLNHKTNGWQKKKWIIYTLKLNSTSKTTIQRCSFKNDWERSLAQTWTHGAFLFPKWLKWWIECICSHYWNWIGKCVAWLMSQALTGFQFDSPLMYTIFQRKLKIETKISHSFEYVFFQKTIEFAW